MSKWNFGALLLSDQNLTLTSSTNQQFTPVLTQTGTEREGWRLFVGVHWMLLIFFPHDLGGVTADVYSAWLVRNTGICYFSLWHGQRATEAWWWLNVPFFYLLHWNQWLCLFFVALLSHLFEGHLEPLSVSCKAYSLSAHVSPLVAFWLLVNLKGRIDKVGCTPRNFDNLTSSQPSGTAWRGFHHLPGRRELSCLLFAGRETQTESQLAKFMNKRQSAHRKQAAPSVSSADLVVACGRSSLVEVKWWRVCGPDWKIRFTTKSATRHKAMIDAQCSGKVENHTACSRPKWILEHSYLF